MPLPTDYLKCSLSDARHRFNHSFIEYEGDMNYVMNIKDDKHGIRSVYFLNPDDPMNCREVKMADPALSIKGLGNTFGTFELPGGIPAMIRRLPQRRMLQGLNGTNCSVVVYFNGHVQGVIGAPGSAHFDLFNKLPEEYREYLTNSLRLYEINTNTLAVFLSPGFQKMHKGLYPRPSLSTLNNLKDGEARVISKKHVVTSDEFGDKYLLCNFKKVAKFSEEGLRYLPKTAFLRQETERLTGLKPAA